MVATVPPGGSMQHRLISGNTPIVGVRRRLLLENGRTRSTKLSNARATCGAFALLCRVHYPDQDYGGMDGVPSRKMCQSVI